MGETEAPVQSDDLRELYREAVAQLLELVPDYDALFGLDPTAPTSRDGVDNWGAELDRAGWSGPLLRFKLAVLRRAGRGPVIRWASTGWARRLRRAIPRRLLKTFLAALNAALSSLGAIPGVDLLREIKEFLEGAIGDEGGVEPTEGDSGNDSAGEPEGTVSAQWLDGGQLAPGPLATVQPLTDYVQFAQTCQNSAASMGHFDRASFLINGTTRAWTGQTDGPALQTLASLRMFAQLDTPTQAVATGMIAANLNLLETAYPAETYNLWEEEYGASFFARAGAIEVFSSGRGQLSRHPHPWLAKNRPGVAPERRR